MSSFCFLAPAHYLNKISKIDREKKEDNPLWKQIRIDAREGKKRVGYSRDPLGELHYQPIPGLLHKYQDRVLILVSDRCSIHCRFCFRRNLSYKLPNLKLVIDYLFKHPEVEEVILSGGDPFSLTAKELNNWLYALNQIPHLQKIRLHSRRVIVDPTFAFEYFHPTTKQLILVTHCNHPLELDEENRALIKLFKEKNYLVLNQGVLLKGINDSSAVLIQLFQKLFDFGVLPYYLHLLDKVEGGQHFAVSRIEARRLYKEVRQKLSGYLVPKFIVETALGKELV